MHSFFAVHVALKDGRALQLASQRLRKDRDVVTTSAGYPRGLLQAFLPRPSTVRTPRIKIPKTYQNPQIQ
eukprot:3628913-Amphidinium_carterae.1